MQIAGWPPYDGDFIWKDAGETRSIKNTGTTRLEFIEFELK
jgi:mannose-6-phosphate isomerase-like protein (cupin superfamily)